MPFEWKSWSMHTLWGWCICTSCLKFHPMVVCITSMLKCLEAYANKNKITTVSAQPSISSIKSSTTTCPKTLVFIGKSLFHFQSVVVCNVVLVLSCLKFHSMVMYIISTLNCFRSICQNNNLLCTAIHIQHKELHYTTYPDSCIYREKSIAF